MTKIYHKTEFVSNSGLTYKLILLSQSNDTGAVQIQVAGDFNGWALMEFPGKFYDAYSFYESIRSNPSKFQRMIDEGFDGFIGPLRDRFKAVQKPATVPPEESPKVLEPAIPIPPTTIPPEESLELAIPIPPATILPEGPPKVIEPVIPIPAEQPKTCSIPNCKGKCETANLPIDIPVMKLKPQCKINGCKNVSRYIGLCDYHYYHQPCSIQGCSNRANRHSMCRSHFHLTWRNRQDSDNPFHQDTQMKICSVPECGDPHHAKGYCYKHYEQMAYGPFPFKFCTVIGCDSEAASNGLCSSHIYAGIINQEFMLIPDYLIEVAMNNMRPEIPDIDDVAVESDDATDEWHEAYQLHAFPLR